MPHTPTDSGADRPQRPSKSKPRAQQSRGVRPAGRGPTPQSLHNYALFHLGRFASTRAGVIQVLENRITRWSRSALTEGQDPDSVASKVVTARAAVVGIVDRLVEAQIINDVTYAESRARNMVKAGRSRRTVLSYLAQKGIDTELAHETLPEDLDQELTAALALAKKRRIGPFAQGASPMDAESDATERSHQTFSTDDAEGYADTENEESMNAASDMDGDAEGALAPRARGFGKRENRGFGSVSTHHKAYAILARAGFGPSTISKALAMDRDTAEDLVCALKQG